MPTSSGSSGKRPGERGLREPIVPLELVERVVPEVGFGDLVRMLAEGIADAQVSLDRASASLVAELASTRVPHIPEIRETVEADGAVRYEQIEGPELSLLELGITPTFYQFSQATVEVSVDIKVFEEKKESGTGKRRYGILAGTSSIQAERRMHREVTSHSKLTARLVPVPMPARLEPSRTTAARET